LAKAALEMVEASLLTAATLEGKSDCTIQYEQQQQQRSKIISLEATEVTATTSTAMKFRVKNWNKNYYMKKKSNSLPPSDDAASANSRANPWALTSNGTIRTPLASRIAKTRMVKPAVDSILCVGNVITQAAVLRGVADHPSMVHARKLAGIVLSKEQATIK
jgi:hypothetical protein